MRKIQAMSRKKRTEETIAKNQPVKVLPQSEKYKEIQSKVAAHIQQVPPAPRPESANYLRSYSRSGSAPPRVRCPSPGPRENQHNQASRDVNLQVQGRSRGPAPQRRPATADQRARSPSPATRNRSQYQVAQGRNMNLEVKGFSKNPAPQRRPATAGQIGRSPSPGPRPRTSSSSDINFVAHNARLARKHQPQRPPSAVAQSTLEEKRKADMENYNKGQVPKYLRNRQQQWQADEAERIRNIPDPEMPPGHKMMPKEERIKTLNILKEKERELQLQLHKVPLNPETFRAKTLKTDIETKLAEVEEAIKIFSRNKVFIKVDS
ncbi:enkurin domain-containing protein 1-like isoform X2 [Anneissia japonica]|nr:enkurin domain-containing protein 1-like isoform X2 [Anneissia japonica]